MSPRIEILNVTKRFRRAGGKTIVPVDGVSLTVEENEFVVLLGPSGCGKTTLLRCVAGLERPDDGDILIDGRLVFSAAKGIFVPPEQRNLSMIFQSYALWPHMTVAQNVGYPLECRGVDAAEIGARVARALDMVGISGLEAQYPGRISGGQQQRVALARALVANTSVILFDEPLSNVDAQVRGQLRLELKRMQRQIGFSGLYVTHDQAEAMELGHRVAVLESGRIAALDTPRRIYEEPPTHYVANFVGVSNFVPGTVRALDEAGALIDTDIGLFRVAAPAVLPVGTNVQLVMRPEKLTLHAGHAGSGENSVPVLIETRLFSGAHTEFVVRAKERILRVWSNGAALDDLADGDPATVSIAASSLRLVPAGGDGR